MYEQRLALSFYLCTDKPVAEYELNFVDLAT